MSVGEDYGAFLKTWERKDLWPVIAESYRLMDRLSASERRGFIESLRMRSERGYRDEIEDACDQGSCGVRASTESEESTDPCINRCEAVETGDRDASGKS